MEKTVFKYKPTKALYKIAPIIKNNQLASIKGGAGAGKTIAILMLLIDFCARTPNQEITICSAELSKLKNTAINDFVKILKDWNLFDNTKWNRSDFIYRFSDTTFIEFIGLDKADVGKGRRRNIIYINEVNKITQAKFDDITLRGQKIICDFNPDKKFFITEFENEDNSITLTFEDNEFIPENEKLNILAYKEKGYNDDGSIKSKYFANLWEVYGCGNYGTTEGRIFDNWNNISLLEFNAIDKPEFYAIDWGIVDPMAVIKAKFDNKKLYVHELNYKSENQLRQSMTNEQLNVIKNNEGGIILWLMNVLQIPKTAIIVCDSAGKDNINLLHRNGWVRAVGVQKGAGSIVTGIRLLQSITVNYTSVSKNIDNEYNNYTWAKDRLGFLDEVPADDNNHTIDAIRYIATYLKQIRLLNNI